MYQIRFGEHRKTYSNRIWYNVCTIFGRKLYHLRSEYGTFVPYSAEYGTFVPYSFLYRYNETLTDKVIPDNRSYYPRLQVGPYILSIGTRSVISVCTRTIEIPLGCILCRDMLKILTFSSSEVKFLKIKFSTHNLFVHI